MSISADLSTSRDSFHGNWKSPFLREGGGSIWFVLVDQGCDSELLLTFETEPTC